MSLTRRAFNVVSLLAIVGCGPTAMQPDLVALYEGTERRFNNPVVAIPGLLGSRLVDAESGLVVWGGADALSADTADPVAFSAAALPLVPQDGKLRETRDAVRTEGVVRAARPSILGLSFSLDIYVGLIRTLIAGGYDFRETRAEEIAERDINLDAFEFPYDWRRDVVEAAQDLDYFLRRKREQVRAERLRVFGEVGPPVQFDLVGHSMGALVARYYLMFGAADLPADGSTPPVTWAGAEMVDTAVMIAPPFSGSITAIDNLLMGRSFGPLQPFYRPALLATFPGLYQLMPRDRHAQVRSVDGAALGSLYDVATWEAEGWGLFDPAEADALAQLAPRDAMARARAHKAAVLARAEQFHRAIDQPNAPPPGLELFLVVGGGFETAAQLGWHRTERRAQVLAMAEGDGVVLRASSLADERQGGRDFPPGAVWTPHAYRSVLLLPEEHVELTLNPVFGDNLLFWLIEGERATARLRPIAGGLVGGALAPLREALSVVP